MTADGKFWCPICKTEIAETDPKRNPLFPFCSERCKLIDLGRWLSGKYQIPVDDSARESLRDDDRD
jgi:uncharacterized protein